MTLALCLQHRLDSEEKGDKLRNLLNDVAKTTFLDEPDNRAYCWFKKCPDSSLEGTWICGFEVYNNEKALTATHRSSPEYQLMRKIAAEENLFGEFYPELIFLDSLNPSGFLNKGVQGMVQCYKANFTFVVITIYKPCDEDKYQLADLLSVVGDTLRFQKGVISYFPMIRKDGKDATVTVFEQYQSEQAYKQAMGTLGPTFSQLQDPKWMAEISKWNDGIGHVRESKGRE